MKKLLLFLCLLPSLLSAQDHYWQRNSISVKGAWELTTTVDNPLVDRLSTTEGGSGFSIGPVLQIPISQRFFFRGGLMMTERQFSIETFPANQFFKPTGPFPSEISDISITTIHNEINQVALDWTLAIGYIFPSKGLNWYVTSGFLYHMYIAERNFQEVENDPLIATGVISRDTKLKFNNTNWSFQMGLGCSVKLNHFIALFGETTFNYNLNRVRIGNRMDELFNGWSLGGGLNFYLD